MSVSTVNIHYFHQQRASADEKGKIMEEIEEYAEIIEEDDFNDYYDLKLEKVRSVNYLTDHLNDQTISIPNDVFCSLFFTIDDSLPPAKSLDVAFIEMTMGLEYIDVDKENLRKLLDLAVCYKVPDELNERLMMKFKESYR